MLKLQNFDEDDVNDEIALSILVNSTFDIRPLCNERCNFSKFIKFVSPFDDGDDKDDRADINSFPNVSKNDKIESEIVLSLTCCRC